jgi:hypothetical protein
MIFIGASRNEAVPRKVKRVPGQAVPIQSLHLEAPARLIVSVLEFVARHKNTLAAVASTLEYDVIPRTPVRWSNYRQAAEFLSGKV